ncbi:MAG TPA: helix-turn-helix transcriptional regulator [Thermoanaerobaculia bacterium]|nr:helix-turn-helix transcriptional regulator [Thermoanaerobaculia bacterium]
MLEPHPLGKVLRFLREGKGLRQYEAAQRAGISKSKWSEYEHGKSGMELTTFFRILVALEVDLTGFEAKGRQLYPDLYPAGSRRAPVATGSGPAGPVSLGSEDRRRLSELLYLPGPLEARHVQLLVELVVSLRQLLERLETQEASRPST